MKSYSDKRTEKLAWEALNATNNRIKLQFSLGKIKTYEQLLRATGSNGLNEYFKFELEKPVNYTDIKEFISDREIELSTAIWLKHNPPPSGVKFPPSDELELVDDSLVIPEKLAIKEVKPLEVKDYGWLPSPNENVSFFWFQKKAIVELVDGIVVKQLKARLLIAGVGTGKTFIIGGLVRRLHDMKFHMTKSISPWPYVYVTKASIVEQTKRVMKNCFGLTHRELFVTNYDQLRSTAGKLWVNEKISVKDGDEVFEYEWRPQIHPLVFLLDEMQSAKNTWSITSQIIQSIAKIKDAEVYVIMFSATPFTKVSEAKAFVLKCHVKYDSINPMKLIK